MTYFHHTFQSPVGILHLVSDEQSLHAVVFEQIWPAIKHKFSGATEQTSPLIERTMQQLSEYFKKQRTTFDVPFTLQGTSFQNKVWRTLANIPYGKTSTYKEQAIAANAPNAARAVGRTNGLNLLCIVLPCHRVIGSNGMLTGFAGGVKAKKYLLELERQQIVSIM